MTRKTQQAVSPPQPAPAPGRERKKPRLPRVPLTHFEVRRGETLRLRIAVANDALAEAGDELGALIKRITPHTRPAVVPPVAETVVPAVARTEPEPFIFGQRLCPFFDDAPLILVQRSRIKVQLQKARTFIRRHRADQDATHHAPSRSSWLEPPDAKVAP